MVAVASTMRRTLSSAYRFVMAEYMPNCCHPRPALSPPIRVITVIQRRNHQSTTLSESCRHYDWKKWSISSSSRGASSSSSFADHMMEDTEPEDKPNEKERYGGFNDHLLYDVHEENKEMNSDATRSVSASSTLTSSENLVDDEDKENGVDAVEEDVNSRPYTRDSSKLDVLATQLPGIVDEILTFHDEIGNNRLRMVFQKLLTREQNSNQLTPTHPILKNEQPKDQYETEFGDFDENRDLWEALDTTGSVKNPWDSITLQSDVPSMERMESMIQSADTSVQGEKYPWDDLGFNTNNASVKKQSSPWEVLGSFSLRPESLQESPLKSMDSFHTWNSSGFVDPKKAISKEHSIGETNKVDSDTLDLKKYDDSLRDISDVGHWNSVERPRSNLQDNDGSQQTELWENDMEEREFESMKRTVGFDQTFSDESNLDSSSDDSQPAIPKHYNEKCNEDSHYPGLAFTDTRHLSVGSSLNGNQSTIEHTNSKNCFSSSDADAARLYNGESDDDFLFESGVSESSVDSRDFIVKDPNSDRRVVNAFDQPDIPYYVETDADKQRKRLMAEGLVLLRVLTENDWEVFDRPHDHDEDGQNSSLTDTVYISNQGSNTGIPAIPANAKEISHEHNDDIDEGKVTLDRLTNLLNEANLGREPLLTADYNLLLVRMAVSPELLPDEILDLMLQTHNQMIRLSESGFDECAPNAETSEIILLALCRRFSAYKTAAQIVSQLLITDSFAWEPKTLKAAFFLCEKQSEHEMARQILLAIQNLKSTKIPRSAYVSFLELMKLTDSRKEAIDLLNFSLERESTREKVNLDKVFITALKWPSQNRYGRTVDNSEMINAILSILEKNYHYTAGVQVWKTLIEQAASGAREDSSRWKLVVRAFRSWRAWDDQPFYLDHLLLRHGLDACGALLDSELAATLMSSRLQSSISSSRTEKTLSQSETTYPVPFTDIVKSLQVCVYANDMHSFERIMGEVKKFSLPAHKMQILFLLKLKGFANRGDTASAEQIINEMIAHNISLGDDTYGALLYACAVEKNLAKAREIFRAMDLGELGKKPGPLCYEGFILACVRSRAWEDAISAFNSMKESGVEPSPAVYHGILLSTARSRGLPETKSFLRDVLLRKGSLNRDSSLLAVKLFIPEVGEGASSLSDLREKFKVLGEAGQLSREKCLSVVRSLRVAELEEQRLPGPGLKQNVIVDRRKRAWTNFLEDLLEYVDATDNER